jgi:proline iminopeptidase
MNMTLVFLDIGAIGSLLTTKMVQVEAWSAAPKRNSRKVPPPINQRQRTVLLSMANVEATATTETPTLRELYPPWTNVSDCRYENGTLSVEKGFHTLFYQVYSNPNATTDAVALFLHGGPGAGCFPNHVRFFDPHRYGKVVLLDQRGCGQSRAAETNQLHHYNTLRHLVDDIETLRHQLQIEQWTTILGGSWGTTLALAYAQEFPDRVYSLILRGVCTMRQSEVDWLFADGASRLFPSSWQEFQNALVDDDDKKVSNTINGEQGGQARQALEGYYNAFFTDLSNSGSGQPNATRAAQSWRRWEFLMSMAHKLLPATTISPSFNLSDQSAVMKTLQEWDANHSESLVAVAEMTTFVGHPSWTLQDANGSAMPTSSDNVQQVVQGLRRNIGSADAKAIDENTAPLTAAPPESLYVRNTDVSPQVLLTCQYSHHRDYCMNGWNLLDPCRMQRLRTVKCIAVQGGTDLICPPDTALDLLEVWPSFSYFELRVPLHAGHSMYDSFLTNELVRATDRIADEWAETRR